MIPLIPIVTGVFGLIGDWMGNKKEKSQARHERDIAVIKGKQKLAEGEQSHNQTWELEALKTASKPLRWVVALTDLVPIWVTMWDPKKGTELFEALEKVPNEWWALLIVIHMFAFANKNIVEILKNFKFLGK